MNVAVKDVQVCLNIIYTDEEWTGTSTSKSSWELAKGISINPGISILITLDEQYDGSESLVGSIFEGLSSSAYILKSFSSDGSELGFGSKATWAALYLAKPELSTGEQTQKPYAPIQLTYGGQKLGAQDISDLKNFSWKSLLVNFLSVKLLGA
ncbi:MAG: hypothetical protein K6A43_08270 [Treponema sp.]|nr:hypothetical protein [Treponema sp.]